MTADHLPQIMKIEREAFPDPWPASGFRDLMSQSRTHWIIGDGHTVGGYLMTQWVLDEIHILNIAVNKAYRRTGIGSKLLEFLFERGSRRGMIDLYLEVRTGNVPAQNFYERFGFSRLSIRKRYYPDGEDAVIMHRRLPSPARTALKNERE